MADETTKEALAVTIRELGRQNEELRRKYEALLKRPKGMRAMVACLGFGVTTSPAQQLILTAQPQVIFKPERFCVTRECAGHFAIDDIKVGMNSQLVAPGSISARLFAVENIHRYREIVDEDFDMPLPVDYDTAMPGMLVTIIVHRIGNANVPFECCMLGLVPDMDRDELPEGPITLPSKESKIPRN